MTRIIQDQAAGLRSLMAIHRSDAARVITVAGGKMWVGKTSVVINLAAALAKNGQRVLIIDENPCHNNICTNLGLKSRFDLLHVINRDKKLAQVILQGPENVSVLSAMRGIHALTKLTAWEQNWLIKSFEQLMETVDIVLIDTAMGGTTHVLPLSLASEHVLIVLSGSAASLTGAYALIKIMSQEYAKQHFLILVNKVDSESESRAIFGNLSQVTQKYLSVSLESIGYVQNDVKLHQSTQLCRSVIDTFPTSKAALCFGQLAGRVLHSSHPDDFDGGVDNFMQRLIRTSHLSMANSTV